MNDTLTEKTDEQPRVMHMILRDPDLIRQIHTKAKRERRSKQATVEILLEWALQQQGQPQLG